jgi:transcriptional regulator with XRE-family HTH domain
MEIRERVTAARTQQGRTIGEVARLADVDAVHLTRFERGLRDMSSDKLARVLLALGLDVLPVEVCEHSSPAVPFEDAPTVT